MTHMDKIKKCILSIDIFSHLEIKVIKPSAIFSSFCSLPPQQKPLHSHLITLVFNLGLIEDVTQFLQSVFCAYAVWKPKQK